MQYISYYCLVKLRCLNDQGKPRQSQITNLEFNEVSPFRMLHKNFVYEVVHDYLWLVKK